MGHANEYDRITGVAPGSLAQTIYAGAGAGTGKTRALVNRIVSLLLDQSCMPENIVAITFTVAAASELRQRVREELENRLEQARNNSNVEDQQKFAQILATIDRAFIGTIHSFAHSLLTERPIDVGLPPVFELMDEIQSIERFQQEWDEWLESVLDNSEFSQAFMTAQTLGVVSPFKNLRKIADDFHADFDLVRRKGKLTFSGKTASVEKSLRAIKSKFASAIDKRDYCGNDQNAMAKALDTNISSALLLIDDVLEDASGEDHLNVLSQLKTYAPRGYKPGGKGELGSPKQWVDDVLEEVRGNLRDGFEEVHSTLKTVGTATVVSLANFVIEMVERYATRRIQAGTLEFQDLLVLSCQLLKKKDVLRYFQSRYTHVLIDEFQDTDPLQLELAKMLSDHGDAGLPSPGALFIVGDPKQSIYRFRRADLTQLQRLVKSLGAEELSLSTNYRSRPEIIDWVNSIFEPWMGGVDHSDPNQAQYEPLQAGRSANRTGDTSRVTVMGGEHGNVDSARVAEAEDISKLALTVGAGSWIIEDKNGDDYQSTYRDLCILIPTRTGLPALETAFITHGVPYVLEGKSAIFRSQLFHELNNNLTAIDDPTDQVAIVAALKSRAWGCSDQDLFEWAQLGHKFEYAHERVHTNQFAEGTGASRVASSLSGLAHFHDNRHKHSTPYIIEWFIRDRRFRELSELLDSARENITLLDLFVELARKLQSSGAGSLREFVRWLSSQTEKDTRINEGVFSTDEINAVRVMTIHSAKGLEFPIVALAGLQAERASTDNSSYIREDPQGNSVSIGVKLGTEELSLLTENWDEEKQLDAAAGEAEKIRLIYVAATRAKEYLFVSLHRGQGSSAARHIANWIESEDISTEMFAVDSTKTRGSNPFPSNLDVDTEKYSMSSRENWIVGLETAISTGSKRGYVTPSRLADHTIFTNPKPEDNLESTEWNAARTGRGGTDVGSAVHDVLEKVEFREQLNLDDLVSRAIDTYSIPELYEDVTTLVRNILNSPIILEAKSLRIQREAWVAAEIEPGIEIEGFIDLLIHNKDGTITIVDYKTDQLKGQTVQRLVEGYEPQLGGYALVLENLGFKFGRAVLVFADGANDGSALEYTIPDLEMAKRSALNKARETLA
jgi:ATP-dependent exoDNAse (exonuclease V) beta subunit